MPPATPSCVATVSALFFTIQESAAHAIYTGWARQVLRAAVMAADPAGGAHMHDPNRSLLKPELIWQYAKGFSQAPEEVSQHLAHVPASQLSLSAASNCSTCVGKTSIVL